MIPITLTRTTCSFFVAVLTMLSFLNLQAQDHESESTAHLGIALNLGPNITSSAHQGVKGLEKKWDQSAGTYQSGIGNIRVEYGWNHNWAANIEVTLLSNRRSAGDRESEDIDLYDVHENRYEPTVGINLKHRLFDRDQPLRPYIATGIGLGSLQGFSSLFDLHDEFKASVIALSLDGGIAYRLIGGLYAEAELNITHMIHSNVKSESGTWSGSDLNFTSLDIAFGLAYHF